MLPILQGRARQGKAGALTDKLWREFSVMQSYFEENDMNEFYRSRFPEINYGGIGDDFDHLVWSSGLGWLEKLIISFAGL